MAMVQWLTVARDLKKKKKVLYTKSYKLQYDPNPKHGSLFLTLLNMNILFLIPHDVIFAIESVSNSTCLFDEILCMMKMLL